MAYRRRQGITRASTFKEEIYHPPDASTSAPSASLAAQAIRASAAHRDSSLSSAYGDSAFHSSFNYRSKESSADDYTSMGSINEPGGFWGVLARKAKAILEDDDATQQSETSTVRNQHTTDASPNSQFYYQYQSNESGGKMDNPRLRKGLDALTTSLNHIGDTIGNALEEGRSIVENRTADIIQETRKLQIRRKGINDEEQGFSVHNQWQESLTQPTQAQIQVNHENQIKASRDVAMATAAKAKLLLRELKTVKADLTFAKQRSSQLEEENKMLREAREKGVNPADDDMIRLQLETLLAEKARLAHENSIYARENRFLREIVEYHQLTMQDVVYLDEGIEEVTEICPVPGMARMLSVSPPSPSSPRSIADFSPSATATATATATPRILKKETSTIPEVSPSASTLINKETEAADVPKSEAQTSSTTTSSHSTTEALTRS